MAAPQANVIAMHGAPQLKHQINLISVLDDVSRAQRSTK
jgi:hypothetical protein